MALRIQLKLPLLFLLSLSVLIGFTARAQQSADDFFHGGAMFYLSNNIPSAKEVVTNGLQRFPEDEKLKKLWELLNQQQQQQQNEQKQDEKKQDEKKQEQDQKQQQQDQKSQESKGDEKKEQKEMQAHAMTPEEAKQLLDAQKGEEQVLQFRPKDEPRNRSKKLKDW
jgi:hypothetical protein